MILNSGISRQKNGLIPHRPSVKEENVYFNSNDGSLCALNSGGILLWTFTTSGVITPSPAIDSDETFLWSFTTGGIVKSSPTIRSDVALYFGSSDGNRYAIGKK